MPAVLLFEATHEGVGEQVGETANGEMCYKCLLDGMSDVHVAHCEGKLVGKSEETAHWTGP